MKETKIPEKTEAPAKPEEAKPSVSDVTAKVLARMKQN